MRERFKHIAILGDGGWGTTLAVHLAQKHFRVKLWGAFPEYIRKVRKTRHNSKFLPGIRIPASVKLMEDLSKTIEGAELIVLAVPSQYLIGVLKKIKTLGLSKKVFLSVIKGIDRVSLLRMSQIIEKELGKVPIAVLSGPTIAMEVAHGIPTTAVIAAKDRHLARELQAVFHSKNFRIYTNDDTVGVELGGSIKNVIALACGICDGLGFGTNAKAAVLTRGLNEMAALGVALGAKKHTFYGLTGLGDLVTTCVNPRSRNRSVGEALGQGKTIKQILASMEMVAEGIETVKGVYDLSRRHKVPMPITEEIFKIIYQNKKPRAAVMDLMNRQRRAE